MEMHECALAFEFRNVYEGEVPGLGEPTEREASTEGEQERRSWLVTGMFVCMIGAALDEPIEWEDFFVALYQPTWTEQYIEGLDVAKMRLKQLSPTGLPIWKHDE